MKFLIKIEEAIDKLILTFVEKVKHAIPSFVFESISWFKHLPALLKLQAGKYAPKLRIIGLKIVGHAQHYITIIKGQFVGISIYLKSDEFKQANKADLILSPLKKFKTDPIKAFSVLVAFCFLSTSSYFIYKNTQKIIVGTKALRAPASAHSEEEPILEFSKLPYHVLDKEIFLDITLVAKSLEDKDQLMKIETEIKKHLLDIHLSVAQLPINNEDITAIKVEIMKKVGGQKVRSVEVKQVLEGRPEYFLKTEKLASLKDLNLQLFLEDTKRNRQIWVDFTALSSNRNIALYIKDHEVEIRDFINMHVEPVIPQLPIEEEGRQIIKDKIKLELNKYLQNKKVEGKILEVYLDYIIVT